MVPLPLPSIIDEMRHFCLPNLFLDRIHLYIQDAAAQAAAFWIESDAFEVEILDYHQE
jgi:hypothetical protein